MINAIYRRQQGGVPQGLSQVSQQLLCLGTVYCRVQYTQYTKVYTTLYTVHCSVRSHIGMFGVPALIKL